MNNESKCCECQDPHPHNCDVLCNGCVQKYCELCNRPLRPEHIPAPEDWENEIGDIGIVFGMTPEQTQHLIEKVRSIEAAARREGEERILADMKIKMQGWAGTAKAMIEDYAARSEGVNG